MHRAPVVGRVLSIEPIQDAHSVRLAHVDAGHGPLQIVFGGPPVVLPGSLVPVVPPGHRAPRKGGQFDVKMRTRQYLGVRSQGMLCSLVELGWVDDGPDEVPMFCGGDPGQALPIEYEPASNALRLLTWLSAESLERCYQQMFGVAPAHHEAAVLA